MRAVPLFHDDLHENENSGATQDRKQDSSSLEQILFGICFIPFLAPSLATYTFISPAQ
jgi:hypothetical protein